MNYFIDKYLRYIYTQWTPTLFFCGDLEFVEIQFVMLRITNKLSVYSLEKTKNFLFPR